MSQPVNASAIELGAKHIEELCSAAEDLYRKRRDFERAGEIFRRASEIADAIGNRAQWFYNRAWWGKCCVHRGRLKEAFVALEPLLRPGQDGVDATDIAWVRVTYCELAGDVPLPLATIEKSIREAENWLRESGIPQTLSCLVLCRSILAERRGDVRRARELADEAWALWDSAAHPTYTADSHLSQRALLLIETGETSALEALIAAWNSTEDTNPASRLVEQLGLRSRWARFEKEYSKAIEYGRGVLHLSDTSGEELARALFSSGDVARGKDILVPIRREGRKSETGVERFIASLLTVDFHLATARLATGMPPADGEFDLEFPPPVKIQNPRATAKALRRARVAAYRTQEIAQWLDGRLECSYYEKQVRDRLKRIEDIERRL
jgi:tetratricopeptide (TPR) repeat protein